jgi:hypothetical protein
MCCAGYDLDVDPGEYEITISGITNPVYSSCGAGATGKPCSDINDTYTAVPAARWDDRSGDPASWQEEGLALTRDSCYWEYAPWSLLTGGWHCAGGADHFSMLILFRITNLGVGSEYCEYEVAYAYTIPYPMLNQGTYYFRWKYRVAMPAGPLMANCDCTLDGTEVFDLVEENDDMAYCPIGSDAIVTVEGPF